MTEWNIQSRGHACGSCGKSFGDKETYHTLLFDEKSEFRRLDVCQTCWTAQYSQGARERKGFISYWQGVYEAPPPPTEAIQKETAESLLRKLVESKDPQYIPATFILAVMLERKRLLKVKDQVVQEGKRIFIYEQPKSGDILTIIDPELHLNQLEAVQRDVAALLEHGLNPPATDCSPVPASENTTSDAALPFALPSEPASTAGAGAQDTPEGPLEDRTT